MDEIDKANEMLRREQCSTCKYYKINTKSNLWCNNKEAIKAHGEWKKEGRLEYPNRKDSTPTDESSYLSPFGDREVPFGCYHAKATVCRFYKPIYKI